MSSSSARTHRITSLTNDRIKAIRALELRKERRETGLFVAEGASLIVTARDAGFVPVTLVHLDGAATSGIAGGLVEWAHKSGCDVLAVSEAVLAKLSAKDNPQSMIAVFRQRLFPLPAVSAVPGSATWVLLEEVRDPGNLGTILRTVDAVGGAGVILLGTCCDPFSRECVRATMGSIFTVPIARSSREEFATWRRDWTGSVVGTHLAATIDFRSLSYAGPTLLCMGSEGPGLSREMAALCSHLVRIPMAGSLDSLNLAVATALALYQIRAPYLKL